MEDQIKWPFFDLAFRQPKNFPSRQKRDKCLTEYVHGKEMKRRIWILSEGIRGKVWVLPIPFRISGYL